MLKKLAKFLEKYIVLPTLGTNDYKNNFFSYLAFGQVKKNLCVIYYIIHWCQIPVEILFLILYNPFYVAVIVKALLKILDN